LVNLKRELSEIALKYEELFAKREEVIGKARKVMILASKSLLEVRRGNFESAGGLLKEARKILDEFRTVDTRLVKNVIPAEMEYAESMIVYKLIAEGRIPSLSEVNVRDDAFLLGLLDAIGEIRREIYERMRKGELGEAEMLLSQAQSIFNELSPFSHYDNFVKGIKRKVDVARAQIEQAYIDVVTTMRK